MERKNGFMQKFALQHQAQTLCAKFSLKSHIMVSGDNTNVITLWRLDKEFPITSLNVSQGGNNQYGNAISSVCFAPSQYEIFSGSDIGHFCMWDIRTRALNFSSKEHSSFISCIKSSNLGDFQNFVLTGSDDSLIKGWDVREKKSTATFNEHTGRINCIEFSPDGQNFVTGSDDCLIKLWDIRTRKCLKTFNAHQQPISSIKFNPFEIALVSTSADGMLNYWDFENFDLMYNATVDEKSIQQATFDNNGEFIFTAAKNTLTLWHVNSENLRLIDKIQIGWDGLQDLEIQTNTKTGEEILIGVGITPSFGLWGSPLAELNKNIEKVLIEYQNLQPCNIEIERDIPNEMIQPQIFTRKSPSSPFNDSSPTKFNNNDDQIKEEFPPSNDNNRMEIEEENGIKSKNFQASSRSQKPDGDEPVPSLREVEHNDTAIDIENKNNQQPNNNNDNGSKMELEEHLPLNELLESTISLRNVENASLMSISYFNVGAKEEDKRELGAISEVAKEHSVFQIKMNERAKKLRSISGKWKSSFAFETVPAIESLDKNEAPMIMSLITASVVAYRIEKVPLEVVCALLKKAPLLLETKFSDFDLYVKIGLGFISTVIHTFSKEIASSITQTPKKGNLIKGEVPKKYTKLVEIFEQISHHEILKEIANTNKTPMGKTAKKIISDLDLILNKPKPNEFIKPKRKL